VSPPRHARLAAVAFVASSSPPGARFIRAGSRFDDGRSQPGIAGSRPARGVDTALTQKCRAAAEKSATACGRRDMKRRAGNGPLCSLQHELPSHAGPPGRPPDPRALSSKSEQPRRRSPYTQLVGDAKQKSPTTGLRCILTTAPETLGHWGAYRRTSQAGWQDRRTQARRGYRGRLPLCHRRPPRPKRRTRGTHREHGAPRTPGLGRSVPSTALACGRAWCGATGDELIELDAGHVH
jgi:hypothetical protein